MTIHACQFKKNTLLASCVIILLTSKRSITILAVGTIVERVTISCLCINTTPYVINWNCLHTLKFPGYYKPNLP